MGRKNVFNIGRVGKAHCKTRSQQLVSGEAVQPARRGIDVNDLIISTIDHQQGIPGDSHEFNDAWPLGVITPLSEDDDWLAGSAVAIEKLRRHLEENGLAVVDGCAVLYLCANSHDQPGGINAVTVADVPNSELVLLREDNEDDPHSGYEIARGDELTCWHQLELSLRDDRNGVMPPISITIPTEGGGAWVVNGIRHVWAIETIKPNECVPGRVFRQIGIDDCERLLHRYKLAKRIHAGGFRHHDLNKRIEYLTDFPQIYRVDLHRVLHLLNKAGLTVSR